MGSSLKLLVTVEGLFLGVVTPTTQKDVWTPSFTPTRPTASIKDTDAMSSLKSGFSPDSQPSQETEKSSLEEPQNIWSISKVQPGN